MKGIVIAFVIAVIIVLAGCTGTGGPGTPGSAALKTFSSLDEMKVFLKENQQSYGYGSYGDVVFSTGGPLGGSSDAESGKSVDYSSTNVQVEGVDELDIVKNDGKYVYTGRNGKVVIVDAFPAASAKIVSTIDLTGNVQGLYINGDKLVFISPYH